MACFHALKRFETLSPFYASSTGFARDPAFAARPQCVLEVDLFLLRRVDRDDSAGFGYDVSDGAILTRHGAVLVAILHPQVEIEEGAGVTAFRTRKPGGVGGSGYGSIASEAYRVPGAVAVIPMREDMRIPVRHGDGLFSTPECQ
jgi:hypothetical protein